MKVLDILTAVLLVVGGLNWGLVALAEFDLVATVVGLEFGQTNGWSRIIYGLVGLSAVYQTIRLWVTRGQWANRSQMVTA
jgi:uncharacterized membrane protein YuzA (DUF378 family)